MARKRTKIELKKLFTRLKTKGISDGMMHELIDLLWRAQTAPPIPGRLTDIESAAVTVTFTKAFTAQPVTNKLEVFRFRERGSSVVKQNVLYTFPDANQPTATGFEINIDPSENLTGVIIEYSFQEIN